MNVKYMDYFTEQGKIIATTIVNTINEQGGQAQIGETYLDLGQSWMWETILVYSDSLDTWFQLLSHADFKNMNQGNLSVARAKEIIDYALKGVK